MSENAQFGVGAVFADGPLIDHLEGIVSTTIIVDGGDAGIGESADPVGAEGGCAVIFVVEFVFCDAIWRGYEELFVGAGDGDDGAICRDREGEAEEEEENGMLRKDHDRSK